MIILARVGVVAPIVENMVENGLLGGLDMQREDNFVLRRVDQLIIELDRNMVYDRTL